MFELIVYEQDHGQRPYDKWFDGIRDKRMQSRIITRLGQVRAGNLGDCKSVGDGVTESLSCASTQDRDTVSTAVDQDQP